ncbi:GGDEF domain-containing protein [Sciscionella sediminilitoris]|uniref:GGDEF domain-containing protein n=1 Tax=Sciscionella sediminilitoris TaxID=1445613 RepID=UPI00068C7DFD|nr:GGDEF domain-containing protein [Sciscionella sp. SE31]
MASSEAEVVPVSQQHCQYCGQAFEGRNIDRLTGLLDRWGWEDRAERLLADRRALPQVLLIIDLDRFKEINDTYGHLAGDQILRTAAAGIAKGVRRGDIVGRYGGDEFLVLLPGDATQGCSVAHRIRHQLRVTPVTALDTDGEPVIVEGLTASIGMATHTGAFHSPLPELLRRADGALLSAKRHGRDRVEMAERPPRLAPAVPEAPAALAS